MSVDIRQTPAPQLRTNTLLILAVGLDHELDLDDPNLRIVMAGSKTEALDTLRTGIVSVLILGPRLKPEAGCEILSTSQTEYPTVCPANIVVGCGLRTDLFQPFVDEDRLFYISPGPMPTNQLRSLVLAGAHRVGSNQKAISDGIDAKAAPADRVLEFCTRLSFQTDLATAGDLLVEALQVLMNVDRAHCLIYDEQTETLWAPKAGVDSDETSRSPCSGLIGYVARTGECVVVVRCGDDTRYDPDTDDPGGTPDARLLAEPMFGNSGTVIAVVAAVRNGDGEPLSENDVATLKLLTACAASAFSGMLLQRRIRTLLLEQVQPTIDPAKVFRQEALQYYTDDQDEEGEVLHSSPAWLKHTHWLTFALIMLGFLWMLVARVHEKAEGQAVVKSLHKMTATASSTGLIRSVVVSQGDHVRTGDLLVQFYDTAGSTTLDRVKQEVRSPSDGVVSDIRVHAGQAVNAGDQIATIVDDAGGYELVAFFPGYYAPQLHPGMKILLKISGYPESHESFVIGHVGAEIIGPHEAEQYAGRESADAALQVSGPVVSVRAQLSSRTFQVGENSYRFYDGMTGETEVIVHSEPLLVYLIPGLKGILRK